MSKHVPPQALFTKMLSYEGGPFWIKGLMDVFFKEKKEWTEGQQAEEKMFRAMTPTKPRECRSEFWLSVSGGPARGGSGSSAARNKLAERLQHCSQLPLTLPTWFTKHYV
jgi:hypothetical protein